MSEEQQPLEPPVEAGFIGTPKGTHRFVTCSVDVLFGGARHDKTGDPVDGASINCGQCGLQHIVAVKATKDGLSDGVLRGLGQLGGSHGIGAVEAPPMCPHLLKDPSAKHTYRWFIKPGPPLAHPPLVNREEDSKPDAAPAVEALPEGIRADEILPPPIPAPKTPPPAAPPEPPST